LSTRVKVLPGATVKVYRNELVVAQGFTDANGRIEFYLEEDLYKVCAEKSGYLSDCITTYLGSDKNLLLLLRRIVEHRVTGTVEYGVSGSFTDEGSLCCIKFRYDPGDSRWYPENGYDEIDDFMDEEEFNNRWTTVYHTNVVPDVVDCLLRSRAVSQEKSYDYAMERTYDDAIKRIVISLGLTTSYDNRIDIILRESKDVQYPEEQFIIYWSKSSSKVCIHHRHFASDGSVFNRYECIGKDSSWHGESLLLIDIIDRKITLYHELDKYISCLFAGTEAVENGKYVMIKVYGMGMYEPMNVGDYYRPFIDFIGVKYGG